jgi:hypothetical protein
MDSVIIRDGHRGDGRQQRGLKFGQHLQVHHSTSRTLHSGSKPGLLKEVREGSKLPAISYFGVS